MKRVGKLTFFTVAALILAFSYFAIFGLSGYRADILETYIKGVKDIRWGIDIRGGVEATLSPADGVVATTSDMKAVEEKIKTRMVANHITDYEIFSDSKNNRIIVRFPWKSDEKDFNPENAIKEIAATARLTFREGDEYETQEMDSSGEPLFKTPKGKTADTIIVEGKDVVSAKATPYQDQQTQKLKYAVNLEFNEEGKQKFGEATQKLIGRPISIWMDDNRVSSATVQQALTDGKAQISGDFTAKQASELSAKISAGSLPFQLETTNFKTISSSLGSSSLDAMLLAGIVSFAIICFIMLFFFRLPGFIACIALIGHLAITFALISGFFSFMPSFTLTIPGITGILLSIGMGVDANIITASRIKEELNRGKTLDKAIDSGSKNSFWAIFDGNVTVIIVAAILMGIFGPANILSWLFGASITGTIYSFGYTLLIGVLCNFLMGMTATRLMTKSISGYRFARSRWLYGGHREGVDQQPASLQKQKFSFQKNKTKFFAASIAIFVVGIAFNIFFGTKLDMQFTGGALINYTYNGEIPENEIKDLVESKTGKSVETRPAKGLGAEASNSISLSFAGTTALPLEDQQQITSALSEKYPDAGWNVSESNSVDPSMGQTFLLKCLSCIGIAAVLLICYIAIRFKKIGGFPAGVMAIVALFHDILMIYFTFVIFKMPINDNFIAVILTILGYSLNDTIVIYDRIRENRKVFGPKAKLRDLVDTSINQTLGRTVLTSVSTFIPLGVIFIVVQLINNITSITTFALPMMVGVVTGCYSSVCVAGPLYVMWYEHKQKKQSIETKKDE